MSTPLQAGDLLEDRYRLIELLGAGGMASVFRADDEQLGRAVAIKLFSPGVVDDARRHESEARTLAGLSDPGLVTLYDARLGGAQPYLVMEFVDGEDLAVRLRRGALDGAEAALLLSTVGNALAAAHARGLVHRDVKPANILIPHEGGTGRARLADFGIARLVDSARMTATGSVLGTAAYIAPEQLRGDPAAPASDVYSLGLVLLEALTGERAYSGTTVEAAMARLVNPPEIPDRLPEAWRRLLDGMTAADPAERTSIAEALQPRTGLDAEFEATPEATTTVLPAVAAATTVDGPTRLLPAPARTQGVEPPTAPTRPATRPVTRPASTAPPVRSRPRRRGRLVAAAAAVLLAVLVVAGVTALTRQTATSIAGGSTATPSTGTSATPAAASTSPLASALAALDAAIAGQDRLADARSRLTRALAAGDTNETTAALKSLEDTTADLLRQGKIDTSRAQAIATAVAQVRSALGIRTDAGPADPGTSGPAQGNGNGNGNGTPGNGNGNGGKGDPGKGKP